MRASARVFFGHPSPSPFDARSDARGWKNKRGGLLLNNLFFWLFLREDFLFSPLVAVAGGSYVSGG